MIIALAGQKLSGKGTVAEYLTRTHSVTVMRFSAILQDILTRLHQAYTRDNLVQIGMALRQLYGDDILAQVLHQDIDRLLSQPTGHPLIVIDGMRFQAEYDILHDLPGFLLWSIEASLETRFSRTKTRQEKSDESTMSLEEFTRRETDPTEQEITNLQAKAHVHLINNGTFEDLYSQIEETLNNDEALNDM